MSRFTSLVARLLGGSLLSGAVALCGAACLAQQVGLHRRSDKTADNPEVPLVATGHVQLPIGAEGEYRWGKLGEEVELYFEEGRVHGYLTERSNSSDDRSAPLTFDFARSHADGHAISWSTRQVHGTWWSFDGRVERGDAAISAEAGFYLLLGTLTKHGPGAAEDSRTVSLAHEPEGK